MSESGLIDRDVVMINQNSMMPSSQIYQQQDGNQGLTQSTAQLANDSADLDERQRVINALEQSGWVQAKAARLLGMSPRQIAYRIQTMNIHVRRM